MRRAAACWCAALALALAVGGAAAEAASARARWDTRVLALIPPPGFPAMAYVAPNGRIYEGTYDNPAGDAVASRVFEYDGDGTLLRSWRIDGQDLSKAHGVQVATSDAQGRLVLLDKSPARALLLDRRTGEQSLYATFPAGSIPNYAAWGPDGSLYVTDYGQQTLWRLPPGGGTPEPWLNDPQLSGGGFGTTGILLQADRHTLLIGQQSEGGGQAGNPSTGRLFTVAIGADRRPGPLRQLWESGPAEGPDGFAIAQSGAVYVALLVANQIAVVGPDGRERERFPSQAGGGANGSAVPFDAPSSVRFLGTRLVVANQSYFNGNTAHQAILDVEAGEPGLPELIPGATKTGSKRKRKARRRHHRRGRTLRGRSSQRLLVTLSGPRSQKRTFGYQARLACSDGTTFTEGRFTDEVRVRRGRFRVRHSSDRGATRTRVTGAVRRGRAHGTLTIVERYRATLDARGRSPLDRRGTVTCSSGRVRWSAR